VSASAARANADAPPRVLAVRRPLVRPTGDPRRLLRIMRSRLVRRMLLLGAVLIALCMTQVWLQLQVVRIGYELQAARQMAQRLDQEHRELQAELAMLRDPAQLAEVARTRLGLVDPQRGQVVPLP
jgi:cell division protein FtsL